MSARSSRHLKFFATEAARHEGRYVDLPSYERPLRLSFAKRPRHELPAGWVPLAAIGSEEPQFLAVHTEDAAARVAMWEHETGALVPVAASLDAFLASLGDSAANARPSEPVPDAARISKVVERAVELADGGLSTKAKRAKALDTLAALTPMLAQLPTAEALVGTRYTTLPTRAWYAQARLQRALGLFTEAVATLDAAPAAVAPTIHCELLLHDLDQPARVLALCAAQPGISPLQRRLWALALLRTGQLDAAAEQLATATSAQVAATCKLSPDTDPVVERGKRLAIVRELVTSYAAKHDLGPAAEDLLARVR